MYLKSLIAVVVTTVIYASSLAGASIADRLADQHVKAQVNSEKKVSAKKQGVVKAANTAPVSGAGKASAVSVPSSDGNAGVGSAPAASVPSSDGNAGAGSAPAASVQPKEDQADNAGNGSAAANGGTEYGETYRHETSIYKEDGSLWRVEYYDDDNRLYEYSNVEDYDKDTRSYTETVYQYDEENNVSVPVRTDTYVNGELVSSVNH